MERDQLDAVTGAVVDAAIKVHSALGPGLLEGTYQACLAHELRLRGHEVRTQVPLPVRYHDIVIELGYRIDLLVDEEVIVELKSVHQLQPIHTAQVLSYLRLNDFRVGLLINFHVDRLRDGIKRFVHRW